MSIWVRTPQEKREAARSLLHAVPAVDRGHRRDVRKHEVRRPPADEAKAAPRAGATVWVLTSERCHVSPEELGLPIYGVFTSRMRALLSLQADALGAESFDRIEWQVSPWNPSHFEGWDAAKETLYILTTMEVDEGA